jgi:hypothetical protein
MAPSAAPPAGRGSRARAPVRRSRSCGSRASRPRASARGSRGHRARASRSPSPARARPGAGRSAERAGGALEPVVILPLDLLLLLLHAGDREQVAQAGPVAPRRARSGRPRPHAPARARAGHGTTAPPHAPVRVDRTPERSLLRRRSRCGESAARARSRGGRSGSLDFLRSCLRRARCVHARWRHRVRALGPARRIALLTEERVVENRNLHCDAYELCLDRAAREDWTSWTCTECVRFRAPRQRAHATSSSRAHGPAEAATAT